jgi:hypothetical protein
MFMLGINVIKIQKKISRLGLKLELLTIQSLFRVNQVNRENTDFFSKSLI